MVVEPWVYSTSPGWGLAPGAEVLYNDELRQGNWMLVFGDVIMTARMPVCEVLQGMMVIDLLHECQWAARWCRG